MVTRAWCDYCVDTTKMSTTANFPGGGDRVNVKSLPGNGEIDKYIIIDNTTMCWFHKVVIAVLQLALLLKSYIYTLLHIRPLAHYCTHIVIMLIHQLMQVGDTHMIICCTPIFVCSQIKSKVNYFSWLTFKPLAISL